jgi:hypothetical protein
VGDFVRPRGRGYSWEQFKAGNRAALKHAAWSPRVIDPRARELVDSVAPGASWWTDVDWPAVWAWARCEARCELLHEWLAERGGDLDDEDNVRPAADLLARLTKQADGLRSKLGLDPLSRARLGRDTAAASVDIARLWASDDDEAS